MSCRGPVGNYLLSLRLRRVSLLAKLLYTWSWANSDFSIFLAKRSWPWNLEITKNSDSQGFEFRDQKILGIKFWDSEKPRFPETLGYPVKMNPYPQNFRTFGIFGIGVSEKNEPNSTGFSDIGIFGFGISEHPQIRDFRNFTIGFFSGFSKLIPDLGVLPNFAILFI